MTLGNAQKKTFFYSADVFPNIEFHWIEFTLQDISIASKHYTYFIEMIFLLKWYGIHLKVIKTGVLHLIVLNAHIAFDLKNQLNTF